MQSRFCRILKFTGSFIVAFIQGIWDENLVSMEKCTYKEDTLQWFSCKLLPFAMAFPLNAVQHFRARTRWLITDWSVMFQSTMCYVILYCAACHHRALCKHQVSLQHKRLLLQHGLRRANWCEKDESVWEAEEHVGMREAEKHKTIKHSHFLCVNCLVFIITWVQHRYLFLYVDVKLFSFHLTWFIHNL